MPTIELTEDEYEYIMAERRNKPCFHTWRRGGEVTDDTKVKLFRCVHCDLVGESGKLPTVQFPKRDTLKDTLKDALDKVGKVSE